MNEKTQGHAVAPGAVTEAIVERVAVAICHAFNGGVTNEYSRAWADCSEELREECRVEARAALRALTAPHSPARADAALILENALSTLRDRIPLCVGDAAFAEVTQQDADAALERYRAAPRADAAAREAWRISQTQVGQILMRLEDVRRRAEADLEYAHGNVRADQHAAIEEGLRVGAELDARRAGGAIVPSDQTEIVSTPEAPR